MTGEDERMSIIAMTFIEGMVLHGRWKEFCGYLKEEGHEPAMKDALENLVQFLKTETDQRFKEFGQYLEMQVLR